MPAPTIALNEEPPAGLNRRGFGFVFSTMTPSHRKDEANAHLQHAALDFKPHV